MRILLTGTTGKVGGFLAQYWQDQHDVIPLTREIVDLADSAALAHYLSQAKFDLLVNPAALSTPEGCENEPELAKRINTEAPAIMAKICADQNRPFIHFSTDYVLDGDIPGFKDETASCRPNNLYGETKLAGETAVLKHHPQAIVARVSWVFGSAGEGFLEKIVRQIREGVPLEGVADKFSLPTSAHEMALSLDFLIERQENGLFHLTQTANEPVSWHLYAEEIAKSVHQAGLTDTITPVTPKLMQDIPVLRTNRPIHTAMTPARLQALGHPISSWQQALRERISKMAHI